MVLCIGFQISCRVMCCRLNMTAWLLIAGIFLAYNCCINDRDDRKSF